jgi:hypothetical protein
MHFRSVFHSQGGDMGIGNQIGAGAQGIKIALQQRKMVFGRFDGDYMVVS